MTATLRVKLHLPDGWFDHSQKDSNGPSLYYRHLSEFSGALQISLAEYRRGQIPNMNSAALIKIAKGVTSDLGEAVEETSGSCTLGQFGSVCVRSNRVVRAQAWCLTDGHVAVLVTHICEKSPDPLEIEEVQKIVNTLEVVEAREPATRPPRWQFWKRR
jgi:hypothetical protein